jgi:ribosomal protein S18 acetylase RimI-like enzyme
MIAIEITHLQPQQWPQYRQIRLEALQNSPQAYTTTYQEMIDKPESFWQDRLVNAAAGKDSWLLFARVDERIAGIIGAFLPEGSDRAVIVSFYVTPKYRGKGVSTALMDAILSELRQNDTIQTVELAVTHSQEAAIGLYKRFGFEIFEEKEAKLGDGQIHIEYTMHRKL